MSSLDTLPAEIIEEIAQHLDVPPSRFTQREKQFYPRRDLLSLASASRRMRRIFFDKTWVQQHVMQFAVANLVKTVEEVDMSVRSKVETLMLRGNWNGTGQSAPTLAECVQIFPNLLSVSIDLVFPFDRVVTHSALSMYNGSSEFRGITVARDPHCLTSVSLSVTKNIEYTSCLSHEWYLGGVVPAIKARLEQVGINKLDAFHLDFVVNPQKADRRDPDKWIDIGERIKAAHVIPAKKVTLDFKGIKVRGSVSELLDALRNGIKAWPLGIDVIQFRLAIDDFGPGSNLLDQFQVHVDGHVTLAEGWIPSEDSMISFVESVLEDRPDLRRFNLEILTGSDALQTSDEAWKQVFEFDYMRDVSATLNRNRSDDSTVILEGVDNAGDGTLASPKAGKQSEPEIKTIIGHTAIRALYDIALERMTQSLILAAMANRRSRSTCPSFTLPSS